MIHETVLRKIKLKYEYNIQKSKKLKKRTWNFYGMSKNQNVEKIVKRKKF